jgi:hypothetical protein
MYVWVAALTMAQSNRLHSPLLARLRSAAVRGPSAMPYPLRLSTMDNLSRFASRSLSSEVRKRLPLDLGPVRLSGACVLRLVGLVLVPGQLWLQ